MGPVSAIGRLVDARSRQRPADPPAQAEVAPKTPSRALVPVGPADRAGSANPLPRPSAPFLAQLIAANRKLPQARERRRAEPHEAIAAYAAAARAA